MCLLLKAHALKPRMRVSSISSQRQSVDPPAQAILRDSTNLGRTCSQNAGSTANRNLRESPSWLSESYGSVQRARGSV